MGWFEIRWFDCISPKTIIGQPFHEISLPSELVKKWCSSPKHNLEMQTSGLESQSGLTLLSSSIPYLTEIANPFLVTLKPIEATLAKELVLELGHQKPQDHTPHGLPHAASIVSSPVCIGTGGN